LFWSASFCSEVALRGPFFIRAGARGARPWELAAVGFLAIALALGGGGSPAPLPELILELLAAVTALVWLLLPPGDADWTRVPKQAWLIAMLVASVPLLQLVPLPAFLWHALPGRELERDALALIGAQESWRAWSLAPSRTLASLLSLAPPLLLLILAGALERNKRMALIRCIALMAVATLVLGALQLSAGDGSPVHLYGVAEPVLAGFQANHNSTADVLLIALPAGPVLLRDLAERRVISGSPGSILGMAAAAIALFAFGVVLTASRMGIMLLPVPLLASLWILQPWIKMSPRVIAIGLGSTLALALLGLMLTRNNPVLATIVARFDFSQEVRPQLWRDGLYVAQKYFPFGVGMGDFAPALIADERLEAVRLSLPNRAHNDYLELACEAGIAGLVALSAISLTLARALWRSVRGRRGRSASLAIFAGSGLVILALHSLVDYPFRSMALACLGAVCAGLLLSPRLGDGPASNASNPGKTR
jgi:O-antigen ligase